MKIVFQLVLLAVVVGLGIWLWTVFFPGPEKMIRQRLEKVAKEASFTSNEGNLARLAAAENLATYFATNVEVNINTREGDRQEFVGRDQIMQAAVAARSQLGSLTVKFLDVTVAVAQDKQSATADMTVDANISGQPEAVVQQVKITFQRFNGQWLITRVETVRVLSILDFEPGNSPFIVRA